MKNKIILWTAAAIVTFLAAFLHQRISPYYPVSGTIGINGEKLTYLFEKIHYGNEPFVVRLRTDVNDISGSVSWRKEGDQDHNLSPFVKEGKYFVSRIEPQPPGSDIKYKAIILNNDNTLDLPPNSEVKASFSGKRPAAVMGVLYFFLYVGLLVSVRGALEYFNPDDKRVLFPLLSTISFFIVSVIFYPFIKSYELGVINKSIPPIGDLFDLPLLIIFLLWFVTAIIILKYKIKVILLVSGILTLIIYQFSNLY
jgi:hypothetical protein